MNSIIVVLRVDKVTVKPPLYNGHFFCPGGQKIHTLTIVQNLSTTATSLQQPRSGRCREV